MAPTIFTMPELPGVEFRVERGGLGPNGEQFGTSWIQITAFDENENVLSNVGFLGP